MNNEKVKEIKKAINCCISGNDCTENCCTYYKNKKSFKCMDDLLKDILTLINELERENAELKKYKFDWLNSEKMHLQADMEDTEFELYCTNKAFKKVYEENQQFKDRIVGLEKENARLLDSVETVQSNRCTTKCELTKMQLKQFAERLKEKKMDIVSDNGSFNIFGYGVFVESIDETLKDFIK